MEAPERGGGALGRAAFGLGLLTDLTPPGSWQGTALPEPILRIALARPQEIAALWSGSPVLGWQGTVDGARLVVQRGEAGDLRFVHGGDPEAEAAPEAGGTPEAQGAGRQDTRAVHHLSADRRTLRCAPADPFDPAWWRVVLDSVLFTVALEHGYEALHAAAVATPEGEAIAITASTGGGKSTLLSELLRRGLSLMADDVLVLSCPAADAAPLAHPAPPLVTVPAARLPALAEACDRTARRVSPAADQTATRISPAAASASPATTPASPVPQPICSLQDECWVAVPVHSDPLPLRCLVVLDRQPQARLSLTEIDDPLAPLMGALLNYPRTRERESARFELASQLAATTSLWRLTAGLSTPVEAIADVLLDGLLRVRQSTRTYPSLRAVVGADPVDHPTYTAGK